MKSDMGGAGRGQEHLREVRKACEMALIPMARAAAREAVLLD